MRGAGALAAVVLMLGAAGCARRDARVTLRFWAMGREGEVVQDLVRDFERENPNVRVEVQQIPWTAAHEKLLTAVVGRSTPDIAQLGNTWVSEFATLHAIEPLDDRVGRAGSGVPADGYFRGIWDTNVIDGMLYGIPWYVDTRVLFYRADLLARAGWPRPPVTWDEWRAAMEAVKRLGGPDRFAIYLPTNEWAPPVILGLQAGSTLLLDGDTRGGFRAAPFRRAFTFYVDLFRRGLAPPIGDTDVANVYQEFGRGYFAMYITGPWNLGEFRSRLPAELQNAWATAPLPGPAGAATGVSLAGGASLVLFRGSRHPEEAWRLLAFLSRPDQQARFYRLTGDLPARSEAWRDSALASEPRLAAFEEQLRRTVATPKVPEWELIATRVQVRAEETVRGGVPPDSSLAALDRDVDRILAKRRWLLHRTHARSARAHTPVPARSGA